LGDKEFEMRKLNAPWPAMLASSLLPLLLLAGCATEQSRTIEPVKVAAATGAPYTGVRSPIAVGRFDNRSSFARGIFADGEDRVGSQSKTILVAHLQQSNRFNVLDRDNLADSKQETQFKATLQAIKGADYLVTGAVSEFGRKEVGDKQLFGLLGRGKTQVAYAKVTLNIVNPQTSEVVYSAQGAGEYSLSEREVLGFGSTASYDATLNGKVLDLAIREAVNNLVSGIDSGAWKPGR
jgi:curli biogenesis system outer membrane secretion channel CsgG